ncbi:MAG: hypothetical protein GC201_04590 [Alphaproteobacteria bacterium]|nr:hypothetical protein [Alphaproteobacteria bacterium]
MSGARIRGKSWKLFLERHRGRSVALMLALPLLMLTAAIDHCLSTGGATAVAGAAIGRSRGLDADQPEAARGAASAASRTASVAPDQPRLPPAAQGPCGGLAAAWDRSITVAVDGDDPAGRDLRKPAETPYRAHPPRGPPTARA